jgi:hypothetical protein
LEALTALGFDQVVVVGISKKWELYSNAWGPRWVEAMMGKETVESFALRLLEEEVEWFLQAVAQPGTTQSTNDNYHDYDGDTGDVKGEGEGEGLSSPISRPATPLLGSDTTGISQGSEGIIHASSQSVSHTTSSTEDPGHKRSPHSEPEKLEGAEARGESGS